MAVQVTKKKKQDKGPADREQDMLKRLMELDVDPGHDAVLESIEKAEDAGIESTAQLKRNPPVAASSRKREE